MAYKRSTDGETTWGPDTSLTTGTSQSEYPVVAVTGNNVNVVWYDDRDHNWEIYYKLSTDGGTIWGTDTRLTYDPAQSLYPAVAVAGNNVHVVWYDDRDNNWEIYYKHSPDGGITWGPDTRLSTGSISYSTSPSVAASGNDGRVVWYDSSNGFQIYYKKYVGTTPEPPTVTSVNPASGYQGQTENVTITGNYFIGSTAVTFGSSVTANSYTVDNVTQMRASITISSSASAGTRNVSITTSCGTGTLNNGFTILPSGQPTASVNTSLGAVNFTTSAGSILGLTNIPPSSMTCSAGGFIFPYGMFSYNVTNLTPGATVTVTITTPTTIPMGSKVFKCQNGNLVDFSAFSTQIDANTFRLTLRDGGQGDADGLANGTIVDPCGPAYPATTSRHGSSAQLPTVAQPPAPIANIAVENTSISLAKVAPGAPVTVTADVANKGTASGSAQVKLYINGQEEAHQGITLSRGSRTPVKFTVSRDEPGTYSVYMGSVPAGTFEVDQFADPNIILYISGALILFALVGSVIYMATRRSR